jgi:hypothetical protein
MQRLSDTRGISKHSRNPRTIGRRIRPGHKEKDRHEDLLGYLIIHPDLAFILNVTDKRSLMPVLHDPSNLAFGTVNHSLLLLLSLMAFLKKSRRIHYENLCPICLHDVFISHQMIEYPIANSYCAQHHTYLQLNLNDQQV